MKNHRQETEAKIRKFYVKGFEGYLRMEVKKSIYKAIQQDEEKMWNRFMNGDPEAPKLKGILGYI